MLQRYWNSKSLILNVEQFSIIQCKIFISTGLIQTRKHLALKPTQYTISHACENEGLPCCNWYFPRTRKKICSHWAMLNSSGKQKEARVSQFFSTFPVHIFLGFVDQALGPMWYGACDESSHPSLPKCILQQTEKIPQRWFEMSIIREILCGKWSTLTLLTWRGISDDKSGTVCPKNVSCFAVTQQWWRFDLLRMSKDNYEQVFTWTLREEVLSAWKTLAHFAKCHTCAGQHVHIKAIYTAKR